MLTTHCWHETMIFGPVIVGPDMAGDDRFECCWCGLACMRHWQTATAPLEPGHGPYAASHVTVDWEPTPSGPCLQATLKARRRISFLRNFQLGDVMVPHPGDPPGTP